MTRALVEEFRARWEGLGGHCWEAADPSALPQVLAAASDALVDRSAAATLSVLLWPGHGFAASTWAPAWTDPAWALAAVEWQAGGLYLNGRPAEEGAIRALAARAALGVTGSAWAVADTGSVALYRGPGGGLWPSLLPPAHLMVVRASQVVANVAEGLGLLRRESEAPAPSAGEAASPSRMPRMVKIISGPSSTADIEGQLWIGVHGPARVGVIVVG